MSLLTVANITLHEHGTTVLHPISFSQRQGQKLALAGESGTGKSTLLQIIAGLIQPTGGEVRVNDRRVRGPQEVLVPGHPGVAYLTQKSDLPKSLRIEQVLRYANKRPAEEAQAVYELCRIGHLLERRTNQLSGGEQQRVALARLLLGAPQLLLLDEPFSNLDREHKRLMQAIIEELGQRLGITCLLVSHDAADTLSWADEILVLHRGQLIQQGPPAQVYRQPVNAYTAALFGDYNLVQGADRRTLAPRHQLAEKALLVRPEQFRLGAAGSGLAGVVVATRFFGSYYEAEIALPHNRIRVRTPMPPTPGETVYVAVTPGDIWAL